MADASLPDRVEAAAEAVCVTNHRYRNTPCENCKALARLALAAADACEAERAIDAAHLEHQREWSLHTFGPGPRTRGVTDHIRKELAEIEAAPSDLGEWVDVIILSFDGAWRTGAEPQSIIDAIKAKQAKNEQREWPDWRSAPTDRAIEHVREAERNPFPTPRYHMLDIWMALGGDSRVFDVWIDEPKRSPADAWSQLCGAIRGDVAGLLADTNPPAGDELLALAAERNPNTTDDAVWGWARETNLPLPVMSDGYQCQRTAERPPGDGWYPLFVAERNPNTTDDDEVRIAVIEGFLDGARHSPLSRRDQAVTLLEVLNATYARRPVSSEDAHRKGNET